MNTNAAPMTPAGTGRDDASHAVMWAWASLLLYPLSFLAAFGIGEGLYSWLADDTADPALWQVLVSAVPALVVFVLPGVLAAWQGRKAVHLGRRAGTVPAVIGVVVGVGFILLNVVAYFAGG